MELCLTHAPSEAWEGVAPSWVADWASWVTDRDHGTIWHNMCCPLHVSTYTLRYVYPHKAEYNFLTSFLMVSYHPLLQGHWNHQLKGGDQHLLHFSIHCPQARPTGIASFCLLLKRLVVSLCVEFSQHYLIY